MADDHPGTARGSDLTLSGFEDFSIEVTTRSRQAVELCRRNLRPGTRVYIAFIPGDSYHDSVRVAGELKAAGFEPVPHVAARSLASFTQLNDFLARLDGEAGVTRLLLVGGDPDPPVGPYESSLGVMETGLLGKRGFEAIGFAGHPEGHPVLQQLLLETALKAKLTHAAEQALHTWLVTQFSFAAAPVIAYARRLREIGVTAPLRVGIAGPAERRVLMKYALQCGIGQSIRVLGSRFDAVRNLLARKSPDDIVTDLAAAVAREPGLGIEGLHLFPFGNLSAAASWANDRLGAGVEP
jgi:methylenetetrahydrofolate reductase (NADPH)